VEKPVLIVPDQLSRNGPYLVKSEVGPPLKKTEKRKDFRKQLIVAINGTSATMIRQQEGVDSNLL